MNTIKETEDKNKPVLASKDKKIKLTELKVDNIILPQKKWGNLDEVMGACTLKLLIKVAVGGVNKPYTTNVSCLFATPEAMRRSHMDAANSNSILMAGADTKVNIISYFQEEGLKGYLRKAVEANINVINEGLIKLSPTTEAGLLDKQVGTIIQMTLSKMFTLPAVSQNPGARE